MTDIRKIATLPASPPFAVTVLRSRESFAIDPTPILTFLEDHSIAEAEAMICRALEDIARRLDQLQAARNVSAHGQVSGPARRIAVIAGGLGLVDVVRIAGHVDCAAETGNAVALSATLARLERAFDAAISAVWEVQAGLG